MDTEPLSQAEVDEIEASYQAAKAAGTLPVISPERDERQRAYVMELAEEYRRKLANPGGRGGKG